MIELTEIEAAAARITGQVARTPFLHSRVLSAISGAEVYVKFENQQFTASFKERGALNKLMLMRPDDRRRGVATMSAGNHAQGLAYHARRLDVPAFIVMPKGTPFIKVEQTRAHGAEVLLAGETLAEAGENATQLAQERGLTFVHPYDDADVMSGAGTVALEMLQDQPDLQALVVPVGGGGLISGMASAAKTLHPGIEVVGVQSSQYPSMYCALRGEVPKGSGSTIAEGIAVKYPGRLTTDIVRSCVDDLLLVDESAIEEAVALYLNIEKTVSEGAGAAGLACLLANRERFAGLKVGLVLSGGNIDPRILASVIIRELMRERRIITLRIAIPDKPGQLGRITAIVAEAGANVLEVQHQRSLLALSARDANLELTFEAIDRHHGDEVIAAVCNAGFEASIISA